MLKIVSAVVALALSAVGLPGPAQAVSNKQDHGVIICQELDESPTTGRVWSIAVSLLRQGLGPEQAGEFLAEAVINSCPHHLPLLQKFIEENT